MPKICIECGKNLVLINERDKTRKKFCSNVCKGVNLSKNRQVHKLTCEVCGNDFRSKNIKAKFCKQKCAMIRGVNESYARMHNNPDKYFAHALMKKTRSELSVSFLMKLYEKQKGLCAISGQPLTFVKVSGIGKVHTNASIDQIEASGGYTEDNVQLTCAIVNIMKSILSTEELVSWCKSIVTHQEG